ncbi:MAG: extracellular solute-binding protein [Chloroflexi bacterium]|nr:extracellular solute-binding protein [Chloroflexota bacterium]
MKKLLALLGIVSTLVALMLAACAPPPAPAPAVPAPARTAAAPVSAPQTSPEQAAWDKVVQAGKKEGKVTVYGYTWVGDTGVAMSRAFKSRYGIDLDIITGRGAEFVERMKTEKRMGAMTADVFEGSVTHLTNARVAETMTASAKGLPALGEKGVWAVEPLSQDKDGVILAFMPLVGPPYINTNMVKPGDEPKSWADLLQPKWKGQMMATDPAISTGAYRLVGYVRYGVFTEDALRQFANQDIRFTTGVQQETQLLAQGQRALSLFMVDSDAASLVKAGAPIKAVSMKEGVVALVMGIGQVKDNPHPNATRVFLNWLFTQEGQQVNAEAKASSSVRKDVPNFTPPAAKVDTKLLTLTDDMMNEQAKLFADKYLVKLWNR